MFVIKVSTRSLYSSRKQKDEIFQSLKVPKEVIAERKRKCV